MKRVLVTDWMQVGLSLYGKPDNAQFTSIVALDHSIKLVEGSEIQYTNDLTYVLGKPLGRV